MYEIVKQILRARNRKIVAFPYTFLRRTPPYFGEGELSDVLSFGFSFVEHEDHCVEYLLVSPEMAKRLIREIDSFFLTVYTSSIGMLWTAQVVLTDKIEDNRLVFSNKDSSVVLDLNLNKIGD